MEDKSLDRVARRFAQEAEAELGDRLLSLTLYGSVARGTESEASDIDVLAVVRNPADAEVLWRLAGRFLREGVLVSIVPETPEEVDRQLAKRSRFLENVLTEGVVLAGRRADLAGTAAG